MTLSSLLLRTLLLLACSTGLGFAQSENAPEKKEPFEPVSGQAGKDVVWVPTPPVLVEKMLDMARVTPADFVMDLGSGDGRNIIAAAKRGANAVGVEYNTDMVDLSNRIAAKEGVSGKARFVQGDMFEADISQATVLALFLLPENLDRLIPKFLDLKPGTRIVLNTFGMRGWDADFTERAGDGCGSWCDALLYIVPAKVAGRWRLPNGELELEQQYQKISGTLTVDGASTNVSEGRLLGGQIQFTAGRAKYTGTVAGDAMQVMVQGDANSAWSATRVAQTR